LEKKRINPIPVQVNIFLLFGFLVLQAIKKQTRIQRIGERKK
jgi:hypothetical protein